MRHLSIKRKLTLIIMGTSTVALLLASLGFVGYELVTFRTSTRANLSTLADMLAKQSELPLSIGYEKDGKDVLAALAANKHIASAALYDQSNRVFAVYASAEAVEPQVPPHPGESGCRFEKDCVTLFRPIRANGEFLGTIFLKSDLQERTARLELCAAMIGLLITVSFAVTFFLSARLQRIITRPIFRLVQTARAVSAEKNYSVRAEKHEHDELGQLIDGFNEMLAEIQQRDAALRRANDELEQHVRDRTLDLEMEISERKRAEAALQDQFTRTSLLNHITHVISERQDLESILYVVLRQLEDHLNVDVGMVFLFERAEETLNLVALRLKNPLLAPKLDLREGMVFSLEQTGFRLCRHGETINVPDTQKTAEVVMEKFAAAGFRSAVAAPLMVENKLFGVVTMARLQPESFTAAEGEFLRVLGEQVALAAHQAQLHAELEKAYNDLRQTQQAVMQQERLKALGQMASGIAHDINNALSPVVGFADLLARGETTLTPNGKKYLQYIKTAGEDIAHIVARLREFYRRRDEGEKLHSLNLNELAKEVIEMTRPRWRDIPQGRGLMIEMRTDFDAGLPELVCIESEAREALTNLILNAVDAIPGGGTITVRTRVNPRDTAQPGKLPTHVFLEVSDTGIGMDDETRKRCLEPFFSTKGQRGTGLGLAMVYGVMERHDGTIEIESEVGCGTTVKLVFPIRELTATGVLERRHEEPTKPLNILCIDDEPLVRELLRELLERDGHQVQLADSGQAGVDAFRKALTQGRRFDVVITDLGMPYLDGRQVTKIVKRESAATPVLMLTGWGAFMKEDGEVPPQVDGIISKPPRTGEIRDALRTIVQARTRSSGDAAVSAFPQ